jgi:hypothetical protein
MMESYFLSPSRGQASQSMITLTDNDLTIALIKPCTEISPSHALSRGYCAYWGSDSAVSQIEILSLLNAA